MYPENKKHDLCVSSIENQFLVSFSLDPALYYATPRHNPRSDFKKKNGLKSSSRLEGKKSWSFSAKKITTGWDITKKRRGGGLCPPPGPFRVNNTKTQQTPQKTIIWNKAMYQLVKFLSVEDLLAPIFLKMAANCFLEIQKKNSLHYL